MVTLMGFPPSNVIYEDEDFNEVNPKCNHKTALIGFCGKGPIFEPIRVKSISQLRKDFGLPIGNGCDLIHTAEQALLVSNNVIIIRIADNNFTSRACISLQDKDGQNTLVVYADSPGTSGGVTQVKVSNQDDETFSIEVFNNGKSVETWVNLNKGNGNYGVSSLVNSFSNWIFVEDVKGNPSCPQGGVYTLLADKAIGDGMPTDEKERSDLFFKAIEILRDCDLDIDLIAAPGCSSPDVIESLINFCEENGDCMAIIDPPCELSYSEAILWQKTLPYTDYGTVFWPWAMVRSHDRNINLIPPSGSAISVIAKSDSLSAPWFPPTGLDRGIIPGILGLRHNLLEEDFKMAGEQGVNPIIYMPEMDTYINKNQLTISRKPISEKRTLFLIKKLITSNINTLLSDCDVCGEYFRATCTKICNKVLNRIKNGQGINDYSIQSNDDLNTPESIESKEFRLRIGIQPKKTDKVIFMDFSFSSN